MSLFECQKLGKYVNRLIEPTSNYDERMTQEPTGLKEAITVQPSGTIRAKRITLEERGGRLASCYPTSSGSTSSNQSCSQSLQVLNGLYLIYLSSCSFVNQEAMDLITYSRDEDLPDDNL